MREGHALAPDRRRTHRIVASRSHSARPHRPRIGSAWRLLGVAAGVDGVCGGCGLGTELAAGVRGGFRSRVWSATAESEPPLMDFSQFRCIWLWIRMSPVITNAASLLLV
ncbi:hypothetical protein BRADI_2g59836v3 [Brachypodium distachyon]|uniref:Uncharacterized protein n=1 Tax=Brachypodium distachyon TaxID=15368 RepID=A0A2K2DGY0_BRADI|nr:hypothetical protein BRADI_2g59836v3 [Brachypodium distachyon]PNT73529.1 hypothetical protein BRADI_2g59836v3 [Brachypodium distachyon]PNT73531.1 hypothetical protein BRADI_2g59836v3 [Brachypodium distachyon]PNT73533.1 hypothetical protein BRADI_2g59836v3 [Brachypodium distachyon]PNT73534.1 hypothetical protein BRADI_2g59836v3 [Brachypodium distachyon]